MLKLLALGVVLGLGGCTHLAGTAYEAGSRHPMAGAVFTVGNPDGVGVFDRRETDANGHFDFYVAVTDENHVYVYDPKGEPSGAQRLERSMFSDHMKVFVTPANAYP